MLGVFKKFINRLVLALLGWIAFVFILVGFFTWSAKKSEPKLEPGSLLRIDLDSNIIESPPSRDPLYQLTLSLGAAKPSLHLRAVLDALEAAAQQDDIRGIVLKASGVSPTGSRIGLGLARELRDALLEFKEKSGKPIHAYLDSSAVVHYYLASVADSITFMPHSTLGFLGLGRPMLFWGGFFEKYGIQAQGVSSGAYKTAVEVYTRTGYTPESRSQRQKVIDSVWETMTADIGASRNMEAQKVKDISANQGQLLAEEALKVGLVDFVTHWDGFLDRINPLGIMNEDTYAVRQISLSDYVYLNEKKPHVSKKNRIAVVYAQGPMCHQKPKGGEQHIHGATLAARLRKLRNDEKIKAVVLRVDTPGGAADAAEEVHRELSLLRETKPVVISMSSIAASGGYYISTHADAIVAQPLTITGSIGVMSVGFSAKSLANSHELYWDKVTTGPWATFYSMAEPHSEAILAQRQKHSDLLYNYFKGIVSEGRKLDLDAVEGLASGRVWSGAQALELGLVDTLGGLKAAISKAQDLAGLTDMPITLKEYGSSSTEFTLLDLLMGNVVTRLLVPQCLQDALQTLQAQDATLELLSSGPAYYCVP